MVSTVTAASFSAAQGVLSSTVVVLAEGVLKSMLHTKFKSAIAVLLVLGITAVSSSTLFSRSRAVEPEEAPASKQEQANRDELRGRVLELKRQLQQMQNKLAQLEQETLPRHEERNRSDASLADLFKYRVAFEIGSTESREGGRIEIKEVWGTRPRIEEGGQYLVRGKYVLPPGKRGTLYFYETATGNWGSTPTATMDLQYTTLNKEKGEFTLMHGMAGPGYFHLILTDPERYSEWFANVYFGTGDNVLRKKSW
jgi:hypothetical protein